MGDLMFQSHWSYSECGLGCEATDLLVALVREECGVGKLYGAKITGGGGGGTVAVLGAEAPKKHFVELSADTLNYAARTLCVRRQLDRCGPFWRTRV